MSKVLLCLVLLGCAAPPEVDSTTEGLTLSELVRFAHGRDLFLNETFGGNDRTCSSCHLRRELGDNFDFTPEDAQMIFAEDPTNPLFRSIDAECGTGSDYTTLLEHGLVRIPFVLPPNITVDEPNGCMVNHNLDGTTTVFVLRSTPTIENIALEDDIMWDGREHADLAHQAGSAVETHYQPGRLPTATERADLAFFQQQFFSNLKLRVRAAGGPAPTLPPVPSYLTSPYWESVRRGRRFFLDMPIVASSDPALRGGHCATCHSGEMLDTSNSFNPFSASGSAGIQNNFTSEVNAIALPALTYHVVVQHDVFMPPGIPALPCTPTTACFPPAGTFLFPAGTPFTVRSPDLGSIYTTGDPCPPGAETFCLFGTVGAGFPTTVSFFRTSTLWGSADSAPYFHDNSCEDLECVVAHYQAAVFSITVGPTGNPGWDLSAQDQTDIVTFMRSPYGFRRTTPL